ncbi:hypothetical protein YB2330_002895 [Saitoella coloradoensis]
MAPLSASFTKIGALYGAAGVMLGAFGAHGLQTRTTEAKLIKNWETASHYLLAHGIALVAISAHPRFTRSYAPPLIALGTAMFSGSIYGLVMARLRGVEGAGKVLGPVTPLGGTLIIAGWVSLLLAP